MSTLLEGRLESRLEDGKPLYSHAEAIAEANRCLYCADAPCVQACPTGIDIPTFIHKIASDNVKGAARTIFADNLLGYSCARVCPVEVLCAGSCVYNHWDREPIQIGKLQRYATESALAKDSALLARARKAKNGRKAACVGGGPASLAAAGHLALEGWSVTIFEQRPWAGGLNTTGVAPYKLHAEDSLREIEMILGLGDIEIRTGVEIVAGQAKQGQVSASSLLRDYDAVFLGLGLGPDTYLEIEGEDGPGVVGATAFIERLKLDPGLSIEGVERALIVGGGNTAIDVARELARLGVRDVAMVYRRGAEVMSGYVHELEAARIDKVRLVEHRRPVKVERDASGNVMGLRVEATNGSKSQETLSCDLIALAIGQSRLTALAAAFAGVELDDKGRVIVDEATCRTGNPKVYAGGDCVNGGKEVVNAAQHGKLAARALCAAFGSVGG
ncbi:MAG: FAD-dependent oxidoreductase [Sandaracinaceae bacterium]|nr:FAD-dependent oxidoreductase [Sandaracinaceae bacterium]